MEHRLPFIHSPFETLRKLQSVVLFVVVMLLLLAPIAPWLKALLIVAALVLCFALMWRLPRRWSSLGGIKGLKLDTARASVRLDTGSLCQQEDMGSCRVAYHSAYLVVLAVTRPSRDLPGGLQVSPSWRLPVFASSLSRDDFRRLSAVAYAGGTG